MRSGSAARRANTCDAARVERNELRGQELVREHDRALGELDRRTPGLTGERRERSDRPERSEQPREGGEAPAADVAAPAPATPSNDPQS